MIILTLLNFKSIGMFEEEDENHKSHEEIERMPLYQKAMEILDLTEGSRFKV